MRGGEGTRAGAGARRAAARLPRGDPPLVLGAGAAVALIVLLIADVAEVEHADDDAVDGELLPN